MMKNSDIYYLENNYVTVVPTQFDMTCYQSLNELTNGTSMKYSWTKKWNKFNYGLS